MKRFFQYQLRTTDVAAARAFYDTGARRERRRDFFSCTNRRWRAAHARIGSGHIDVGDVDATAAAWAGRGATLLGPKWVNPQGLEAAVMRDPGGALVSCAKPAPTMSSGVAPRVDVVWHQLNTADVERARANYGELFGWEFKPPVDLGVLGVQHPFAWQAGGVAVGAFSDIASRPGVHPHWLFHFRTTELERAVDASVRAARLAWSCR